MNSLQGVTPSFEISVMQFSKTTFIKLFVTLGYAFVGYSHRFRRRTCHTVGELIEDEMHRGREFPAIIRKSFSAQLVDGLPHEDGEQETEGLVGIGEDAENRHLRIRVTKGVNLHLVIGQKLAHAICRDGRKAHVAGNEDGF